MADARYVALFIFLWILIGLVATNLALIRRGHRSGHWYFIGAALGPLFIPIAIERAWERKTVTVLHEPEPASMPLPPDSLAVLIALDGSVEADRAMYQAMELLRGRIGRLVLATVLDYDAVQGGGESVREEARELLLARSLRLPADLPSPCLEVAAGRTVDVLIDLASSHRIDLLVIGPRRGDVETRLRGSVAADLVKRSFCPVLVGPGQPTEARPSTRP